MAHTVEFEFKASPAYRKDADGKNIYTAIASTATLDRDGEVLIPKGCIIDNFMKNPVMLNIHDHRKLPVGKVVSIDITDKAVSFDFEFYDDEQGKSFERMYQKGFMNAFSVGFYPTSYVSTYRMADEVESIDVELPDGSTYHVDFSKYPERPYGIIPKWELWEISPVPVPSNPDALLQRSAETIVRKFAENKPSKAVEQIFGSKLADQVALLSKQLGEFLDGKSSITVTGIVDYEKGDSDDSAFVFVDELGTIAVACSADKSGELDQIDWNAFSKAFGWFDIKRADNLTGYKFLHHTCKKDTLHVSIKGLMQSMSELLGSNNPDKKAVYDHLVKHYVDLGLTPPDLKEGDDAYTPEQLVMIAEGVDPNTPIAPVDDPEKTADVLPVSDVASQVKSRLDDFDHCLKELNTSMKIRMQVIVRMLEELSITVNTISDKKSILEIDETADSDMKQSLEDALAKLREAFPEASKS